MNARLSWPVALGLLLTCSKAMPDDWASWGDTRSAIEYSSLLSGWSIDPKNNRISFETKRPLVAVYLPTTPMYFVKAELWNGDGSKKLQFWDFELTPNQASYPFLKIKPRAEKPFAFTDAGDYVLRFWARDPRVSRGLYITQLQFQVEFLDDPEKPKAVAVLSGPWDQWAYLWCPYGARESGRPQVRIWRRADLSTKPEGDEYTARILKNNRLVARSEPQTVKGFQHTRLDFSLTLPENLKGGELVAKDLLAQIGEYHVLIEKNGKPDGAYTFAVEHRSRYTGTQFSVEPMFQFHKNQRPVESSLADYIVPRMPGEEVERDGAGDTVWMERMSPLAADLVFNPPVPANGVQIPNPTPLVNPVGTIAPVDPMKITPMPSDDGPMPSKAPMRNEVASLTVKDAGTGHTIPLPMDTKPNDITGNDSLLKRKETDSEESLVTKPTPEAPNPLKADEPAKPSTRSSADVESEVASEPPRERPAIWESHLGLIATIFAAHLAVGVFCSYKILKAT